MKGEKDELPLFTGCSLWRYRIDMAATVLLNGVGAIPPLVNGILAKLPR